MRVFGLKRPQNRSDRAVKVQNGRKPAHVSMKAKTVNDREAA